MTEHNGEFAIIVVGASAGGVEAMTRLVAGLPANLNAAVLVVLHIPPNAPSALAAILARSGTLPATQATDGSTLEPGRIYVAVPNRHLVVHRAQVRLEAGPRENSARPAVDVLFRSAARVYGRRVIGVVLSGMLNDGALGLASIKIRGGVTFVQDPHDALFADMPKSALNTVDVDYCLPAAAMGERLTELTQQMFERVPMNPSDVEQPEYSIHAADEPDEHDSPKLPNAASGLTCPECHGSLWELSNGNRSRFECRVGHAYSLDALIGEQGEAVEAALWSAVNALQERAATFRRLGSRGSSTLKQRFLERAELTERHSSALLNLLHGLIAEDEVG